MRVCLWLCLVMVATSCATMGRAAKTSPDAVTLFNQGVALENEGRPTEALTKYESSRTADPDFAPPRYNLSLLLVRRGELPSARREVEALLQLYARASQEAPELGRRARWGAARAQFLVGERGDARQQYLALIKDASPDSVDPIIWQSLLDLSQMYSNEMALATLLAREVVARYDAYARVGESASPRLRDLGAEALYRTLLTESRWIEESLAQLSREGEGAVPHVTRELLRRTKKSMSISNRLESMRVEPWSSLSIKVRGDLRMYQARFQRALPCPPSFAPEQCAPYLRMMSEQAEDTEEVAGPYYIRALTRANQTSLWPDDLKSAYAWMMRRRPGLVTDPPEFQGPAISSFQRHPAYIPRRDRLGWRLGAPLMRPL